ncbi:hypothetical protein ACU635_20775 [[Actinomadura] parvosata]|uniref:hypothetical protein n=1 Tax=[Actinomadura] parvosata TaxID=1955412 RepID=UPI00406D030D
MFGGRVREIGRIEAVEGERIVPRARKSAAELRADLAPAVAGVRITVEEIDGGGTLVATVTGGTRRRTTLDELAAGPAVNVEVPPAASRQPPGTAALAGIAHALRVELCRLVRSFGFSACIDRFGAGSADALAPRRGKPWTSTSARAFQTPGGK